MTTKSTFTDFGWDFTGETQNGVYDTWAMPEQPGYPKLSAPYAGGSGTKQDPFLIATAGHLQAIGAGPCDWDDHFLMVDDINLAGMGETEFNIIGEYYEDWDLGESVRNPFTGVFDGNGHTISNLWIYRETDWDKYFESCGMFGCVAGMGVKIKDLTLADPNVSSDRGLVVGGIGCLVGKLEGAVISNCGVNGGSIPASERLIAYTGGLVGWNYGGTISDCHATGSVSGGYQYSGGLVGYNEGGTIENCYLSGSVYASGDAGCAGGLLGRNNGGTVSNCHAPVWLQWTGSDGYYVPIGGLVGENIGGGPGIGRISNSYSTGLVLHNSSPGGGLVGLNDSSGHNETIIENCYSSASVSTTGSAGGLVGNTTFMSGTIRNCYATGSVSGDNLVGGLSGTNAGTVENCYATGSVQGTNRVGGLTGHGGTTKNCYATGNVNGTERVGGLVGSTSGAVENCYARGKVGGTNKVGGLVGENVKSIDNCYSTGLVIGDVNVGGLVGVGGATATVSDSFWDVFTSCQPNSAGGQAKITPQMQTQSTFTDAGWDFIDETTNGIEDIWRLCEDGTDYPKLVWQMIMLGDFVCGDGVDFNDLDVFMEQWLMEKLSADVAVGGGDGIVDFLDWAVLADGWQNTIDINDVADFAGQWLQFGAYCADIAPSPGGDGAVDMLDFAVLGDNWLGGL